MGSPDTSTKVGFLSRLWILIILILTEPVKAVVEFFQVSMARNPLELVEYLIVMLALSVVILPLYLLIGLVSVASKLYSWVMSGWELAVHFLKQVCEPTEDSDPFWVHLATGYPFSMQIVYEAFQGKCPEAEESTNEDTDEQ